MKTIQNFIHNCIESFGFFIYQDIILETGKIGVFFIDSVKWWFKKPYRWLEVVTHIEFVGNKSLVIIMLTGAFTGLVFTFQAWVGLSIVNAENLIGPTVGLGITRELGPVLTGLIIAARAGGAMAARLGTMRVTEQIDALEVMGVDAKNYLVAPRILASVLSTPLLTAVFDFVALGGGYFLNTYVLQLDPAVFLEKTRFFVDPSDINEGLIKSAVFGLIFSTICCYRGYNTSGGAKGVGDATNQGVVASMVSIIIIDFFLTKIIGTFNGYGL